MSWCAPIVLFFAFATGYGSAETQLEVRSESNPARKFLVRVRAADNTPVNGLVSADFTVSDSNGVGVPKCFTKISRPLDVLLVLDVSGSMNRAQLLKTVRFFLASARSGDRIGIALFATEFQVIRPLDIGGPDPAHLAELVDSAYVGNETFINRAVRKAADYVRKNAGRAPRIVLMVSDNIPDDGTGRTSVSLFGSDASALRALWEADVRFCGVLLGSRADARRNHAASLGMYQFSKGTGGWVVPAGDLQLTPSLIDQSRVEYILCSDTRAHVALSPALRARYPGAALRIQPWR